MCLGHWEFAYCPCEHASFTDNTRERSQQHQAGRQKRLLFTVSIFLVTQLRSCNNEPSKVAHETVS